MFRLDRELDSFREDAVGARSIASVFVDGELLGTGRIECVLPVGPHTLVVSASGAKTYDGKVTIAANEVLKVEGRFQAVVSRGARKGPSEDDGGVLG